MFGNLFDDDGGDGATGFAQTGDQTPLPPSPRNRSGLAGIYNQGSTCFLNSALQVLAFTPEFRIQLFQLPQRELGKLEDIGKDKKVREVPLQIQRLFAMLMLENQKAVSSKDVTDSFGWTSSEVGQQHDAQELNQVLLDAIGQNLCGTAGESLISQLFHGKFVHETKCQRCGQVSKTETGFSDLFVPVEGFPKGLQESLHSTFCSPEVLTGSNRYKCPVCKTHEDAVRTTRLRELPPILKMTLMRFSYDKSAHVMKRYKVTDRFPFPMEIDMSEYTEHGRSEEGTLYELYAVIVHGGSCEGGHYTACIRDIDNLGHWEDPDSGHVQVAADPSSGKLDLVECQSPQQLVATILGRQPQRAMTMDKLSAEILKQTGVSWAKFYKRRHGSFPKFIKDNAHMFLVEGSMVALAGQASKTSRGGDGDGSSSSPRVTREDANDNCSVQSDGDVSSASHMVNGFPGHHNECPPPGQRWYFFNDSNVSAMHAKDLQNEFAGKTSAYLLFYRRKGLPRPSDAEGDPGFSVPCYLLEEVDSKNKLLEKEREEYAQKEQERREEEERKKMEVQVEIRFHWTHRVDKGVLQTEDEPIQLTCQRLSTLGDLFTTIATLGGEPLGPDFCVHRMRCWDDKTHLFDELTDREKTLSELSVENGTILFVWDGKQVGGQDVPTGLESEPITLHLKQYCSSLEIVHNFPKNLTLKEFRSRVSGLTGVPVEELRLQFPEVVLKNQVETNGEMETLESIHLRDHLCILFDGSSSATFGLNISNASGVAESTSAESQSDHQFCVRIENRCDEQDKHQWPVLEMEVDKDMTVREVKEVFMTLYCINCESAALRENNPLKGLQAPYDETMTVESAGITKNTHLILENMMMVLAFKLSPQPQPDSQAVQVTVHRDCTVEECLHLMVQAAGLSDASDWHLRKTNFFGEPANILDDLTKSLNQYAVNPGDFLILEHGRLLPKGFVSLSVWLYPSPDQPGCSPVSPIIPRIEDLLISDSSSKKWDSAAQNSVHLGQLEMEKDATLEELRNQVQELMMSKKHRGVKATQLRISLIDGKRRRLRRVLRGPLSTLRRLKVNGENDIGVQIVGQAADPSPQEVVLNVRMRKPNSRSYGPPQELVWDSSHGTSAASLKLEIACRLLLPEDTLTIAKHFPDQFHWKVLTDHTQNPVTVHHHNNRKGKKRAHAPRSDIRQKPFYVQDGDVIGVLHMSHLPLLLEGAVPSAGPQDFTTAEDEEGQEQQLEEQRQKQLERQARTLVDGLSGPRERRPEVPLKIRIGDFT